MEFQVKNMKSLLFLCLTAVVLKVTSSNNEMQHFIEYEDHCSPDNASTCDEGNCCVKQTIILQEDEYSDPKPGFRIACRPLKLEGEFCLTERTEEMCPCACHLECLPARSGVMFGHCALRESGHVSPETHTLQES